MISVTPARLSASTILEPMKPAAPVTSQRRLPVLKRARRSS
jgi:hypothetical protein